jgi:ribonucleoside-diphosphate reductase alpha chain
MQIVTNTSSPAAVTGFSSEDTDAGAKQQRYAQYKVIRRNGAVVAFEPPKIAVAMTKAFLAVNGGQGAASARIRELVARLADSAVEALIRRQPSGGTFHIEDIQDQVELALMRAGEHEVARSYVLYREQRSRERARQKEARAPAPQAAMNVIDRGETRPLDLEALAFLLHESCEGLGRAVDPDVILQLTLRDLYDGVPMDEVRKCTVLAARSLIEKDPAYSYVTARLLLNSVRCEVLGEEVAHAEMRNRYAAYFPGFIRKGIEAGLLDERLGRFDLDALGAALDANRDLKFGYLGLQTLYDRYFLHVDGQRIELPQAFFMRVAMGLAINEVEREARAIEFYNVLSSFDFMSSTPTLFNSGSLRSQLSSCYLTTVSDHLEGIYDAIKENALLSKFAGGLGNDWTPVRALGSHIKGTNGKSQGVVPFLKVVNDTAVAVNQGGKRKGAVCSYLESWHLDIEEFLELRKNTGDDRRRTHDMNTANWVPDLFMKRVIEGAEWTLFSPADVPDLHDRSAAAPSNGLMWRYEEKAARGELKLFKKLPATQLWRKMLTMLFETGHPWITFKDPCNIRSPQQHVGVVHSSNLCTEITLNTSTSEIAVCNLGSVNLVNHLKDGKLDMTSCARTVAHRHAHARQRDRHQLLRGQQGAQFQPQAPSGGPRHHGLPGLPARDARALRIAAAVEFADRSMEAVAYNAYWASTELAEERGRYSTYDGSLWSRASCRRIRSSCWPRSAAATSKSTHRDMDWDALRERITQIGMRNSNCLAIAPTATIANIVGVSASIEPIYQNLYVKSNLSGEFTVTNEYLVRELKALNVWDEVMIADLKYFDGSPGEASTASRRKCAACTPPRSRSTRVAGRGRRAPPEVDRPGAVAQHILWRVHRARSWTTPTSWPGLPRPRRGQADHQRQGRRQSVGAVQVQMGLGKVHRRLREPLDAAGSEHEPRHRHLERPQRSVRRRAPHHQAQPGFLRHRRQPGRQQHRARHLSPDHRAGMPPVPAAPGVRGSHPHPRLPVHRRKPGAGRGRNLQRLSRSQQHPGQG